jgi:pre-mRNA-splicing factor 38A
LKLFFLFSLGTSSYHQPNNRRSARYPDREKDRLDRSERERERIHAMGYTMHDDEYVNDRQPQPREHYRERDRDRERGMRGGHDEFDMYRDERRPIDRDPRHRDPRVERNRAHPHLELESNNRHLMNDSSYDDSVNILREKEKERYIHRRDRDPADYSPHRGGNRRAVNANAM